MPIYLPVTLPVRPAVTHTDTYGWMDGWIPTSKRPLDGSASHGLFEIPSDAATQTTDRFALARSLARVA